MPSFFSENSRIAYTEQGSGSRTWLFLPGWCGSSKVFAELIACFPDEDRVLTIDWRGHGDSTHGDLDFNAGHLVSDVLALLQHRGIERVIPVSLSHAGWIGLALQRRLHDRIPGLVWLDWIVSAPPPPFAAALADLQSPERWRTARDRLFSMWLDDADVPAVRDYIHADMGSHGFAMWARAGREIAGAYATHGSPLQALAAAPQAEVLHLYAQPPAQDYLRMQQQYAQSHPHFEVRRIDASSHFPLLEKPAEMAALIRQFGERVLRRAG